MEANKKARMVHELGSLKGSGSAGLHQFLPRFINLVGFVHILKLAFLNLLLKYLRYRLYGNQKRSAL